MQLTFLHPSTSDSFLADVEPACTGELAVRGLIESGFVPKPRRGTYDLALARTRSPIAPNQSFAEAGVVANDQINIFHRGSGAV